MSSAIEVQGVKTLLLLLQLMLCSLVAESMKMCMQFLRFTCQGSSSHFSRLHTAIRLPESDENRAEPTIPDRGYVFAVTLFV